jgi:signal transduction histidine kinase/ligand-binding sensor domain-containing protein
VTRTMRWALLWVNLWTQFVAAAPLVAGITDYKIEEVSRNWHAITSLAETADGHLWIGTISGVIRWDGVASKPFGWADGPRPVRAMAAGRRGPLWVATGSPPALSRLDTETQRLEDSNLWHDSRPILALAATSDSVFVASDNDLFRISSGDVQREAAVGGAFRGIAVGPDETVFVLTSAGLWRSGVGGQGKFHSVSIDAIPGTTSSISATSDGLVMIGTLAGEVWRLDGSSPSHPTLVATALGAPVRDVVMLESSTLFIATRSAGFIEQAGERRALGPLAGIGAVLRDHLGHVWIGGRPALHHLFHPLVTNFKTPNTAIAFSVAQTMDGHVWASMGRDLIDVSESDEVRVHGPDNPAWPNCLRGLSADPSGGLWVAACRDGLMRIDGERTKMFPLPTSLHATPVRLTLVLATRRGGVWATTDRGHILKLTESGLTIVHSGGNGCDSGSVDDQCPSRVTSMVEYEGDSVLFGTIGSGVLRMKGNVVEPWLNADALGTNKVLSLRVGGASELWIGTRDVGLALWRRGRLFRNRASLGNPASSIHSLAEDGSGQLWFGSTDGVRRVDLRELSSSLDQGQGMPIAVVYNRADGLENERCSDGFAPGALRDRLGRMWFATHAGLSRFSAPTSWNPKPLAGVSVESVSVDGIAKPVGSVVRMPFHTRRVQLDFIAPVSWQSHRVSYRYRLQGFDSSWIASGASRQAIYTNLPVGNYAFVVTAQMDDFAASRVEYTLPLVVESLFDRSITWIGMLVLLLLVAFAIQRWRGMLARRRFQLILDERNRIARDVHDTVAQGFVAIGLQLDRTVRRMQKDPAGAVALLTEARSTLDQCRAQTRQAVWNLRDNGLQGRSLKDSLEAVASQGSLASNVSVALDVKGAPLPVADNICDALCAMVGESLTNAVAHGHAGRVQVQLVFSKELLTVSIKDNGNGFDVGAPNHRDEPHLHLGLVGLRERAAGVGGEVKVMSVPSEGTEVVITVPLQKRSPWQRIFARRNAA